MRRIENVKLLKSSVMSSYHVFHRLEVNLPISGSEKAGIEDRKSDGFIVAMKPL